MRGRKQICHLLANDLLQILMIVNTFSRKFLHVFALICLLSPTSFLYAESVVIGQFSKGDLSGWEEKVFEGKTVYKIKQLDEKSVLESYSSNSASGLLKKVEIDLRKTPFINWSWKVKDTLATNNERAKSGDDFSARIYVVFSDGSFFWQTKTLNYVWANHADVGYHWPNPYTKNAQMIAIQTGNDKSDQWQAERRNVLEDIQTIFGKKITDIKAIAIMSDTDQTGTTAEAWFGDIWFSD